MEVASDGTQVEVSGPIGPVQVVSQVVMPLILGHATYSQGGLDALRSEIEVCVDVCLCVVSGGNQFAGDGDVDTNTVVCGNPQSEPGE